MTRMQKWLAAALAVAVLMTGGVWTLGDPQPVQAQQSVRYWWQLVNERGRPYPQGTAVCSVFRSASGNNPEFHLYTTAGLTVHGTSPLLGDNNGVFSFYSPEDTVINVVCWTKAGDRAAINKLDKYTHTLVVDRSNPRKITRIPMHTSTATVNTGVFIPQGAIIRDVIYQNMDPSTANLVNAYVTKHIEIGFRGNHAVSANVGGLLSPMVIDNRSATTTTAADWYYPTQHINASFDGGGAVTGSGTNQYPHLGAALRSHTFLGVLYRPYMVHLTGGLEITWRTSNNPDINGHAYIIWDQLHVGADAWSIDQ